VSAAVVQGTETALRGFFGPDGRHEGIVFWCGRRDGDDHVVTIAIVPRASHGAGFVHVDADQVGDVTFEARSRRLVLLAQVHSHPDTDTRHSDADDRLILLPYEGMFSLVAGSYGRRRISVDDGVGIHQFQREQWVQVTDGATSLIVVPAVLAT
jgi:proteasome lid subunit RPN8/RPN11